MALTGIKIKGVIGWTNLNIHKYSKHCVLYMSLNKNKKNMYKVEFNPVEKQIYMIKVVYQNYTMVYCEMIYCHPCCSSYYVCLSAGCLDTCITTWNRGDPADRMCDLNTKHTSLHHKMLMNALLGQESRVKWLFCLETAAYPCTVVL